MKDLPRQFQARRTSGDRPRLELVDLPEEAFDAGEPRGDVGVSLLEVARELENIDRIVGTHPKEYRKMVDTDHVRARDTAPVPHPAIDAAPR
jgi:hypothetical protein